LLSVFAEAIKKQAALSAWFSLGVQDLSPHNTGAYTGAVCAQNLQGLAVNYTLVGHSERRRYFHEDNQVVAQKFIQARKHQLRPIICLEPDNITAQAQVIEQQLQQVAGQDWGQKLQQIWRQAKPGNAANDLSCSPSRDLSRNSASNPSWLVAYEPSEAIGSGNSAAVQQVTAVKKQVAQHFPSAPFLYGGSVDENNVGKYLAVADGVLVGGASLQAEQFVEVIQQALSSVL
jgi:triosephosphate isomerase